MTDEQGHQIAVETCETLTNIYCPWDDNDMESWIFPVQNEMWSHTSDNEDENFWRNVGCAVYFMAVNGVGREPVWEKINAPESDLVNLQAQLETWRKADLCDYFLNDDFELEV